MKKAIIASVFALAFSPATAQAEGDAKKGKSVYGKCKACHDAVTEKNKIGPHLVSIVGRKAGVAKGYNYSAAMKKAGEAGLVWTDENLHKYIENPRKAMKGNKMPFPGLRQKSDRDDLFAYLKTLKPAAK